MATAIANSELKTLGHDVRELQKEMVKNGFEIGKKLSKARKMLSGDKATGEWRAWLKDEAKLDERMSRRFINVYQKWRGNAAAPNLPFTVLAELAAPEAESSTVKAIEEHIAQGGQITQRQVVALKKGPPITSAKQVAKAVAKQQRKPRNVPVFQSPGKQPYEEIVQENIGHWAGELLVMERMVYGLVKLDDYQDVVKKPKIKGFYPGIKLSLHNLTKHFERIFNGTNDG